MLEVVRERELDLALDLGSDLRLHGLGAVLADQRGCFGGEDGEEELTTAKKMRWSISLRRMSMYLQVTNYMEQVRRAAELWRIRN